MPKSTPLSAIEQLKKNMQEEQRVPDEQVDFSQREHAVLMRVAQQMGVSVQEATEFMAKQGLASRVSRRAGRVPAQVYQFPARSKA